MVVGEYDYELGMNQISTLTVRELARERTVLYLCSEVGGSLLNLARGRGAHLGARRTARIAFGTTRPRRVEERLWVAPVRGLSAIPPVDYPEAIRRRNLERFARIIGAWLQARGAESCLLLAYWWSFPELLRLVPWAASAYDCTDDHAAKPGGLVPAARIRAHEQQLLDAVDRTWIVSPGLEPGRAAGDRRLGLLPTPIDLRLFARVAEEPALDLPALQGRTGPLIGYAGGLTDRLDWPLLEELARRRPDWTFVFVGGRVSATPESLRRLPNVAFTGTLPYDQALRAIARFDVGVIPVRDEAFARGNSFLKLSDYAASGLPIVATSVPDTLEAAGREPEAIVTADGADAWIAALDAAVHEKRTPAQLAASARLAAERSNERRVATILSGLEEDRVRRARTA